MPHRLIRRTLSWLELHPRTTNMLGMLTAAIAILGLGVTLWLHSDENHRLSTAQAQIQADRVANQARLAAQQDASRASAIAIRRVLCPLIYTYEHLDLSTPNGSQVANGWRGVGSLIGCPNGTRP